MTDYKRIVSYMYQYENGVKRKNVGFARIEAKEGQCKITLHMQLLGQLDSIFPTYLIQRKEEGIELIYLGDSMLKDQVMDSKLTAEAANIMDSGYGLSDMGGLLLFLNDSVFFATEWDDRPIREDDVIEALKPKPKQEPRLSLAEEIMIPKYKLPRGYKIIERLQKPEAFATPQTIDFAKLAYDMDKRAQEEMPDASAVQVWNEQETRRTDQDNLKRAEQKVPPAVPQDEEQIYGRGSQGQENINWTEEDREKDRTEKGWAEEGRKGKEGESREQPDTADPQAAAAIFDKFPRIYPFEDNEILICAKIEPKDIGMLPKELWVLSNNSFLVHGYYCYHHLIFAKLKDRYGSRYIIGVPGIYHNRERFMARMFGFDGFKPIRKRELRQGDFGYWYMPVSF